MSTKNDRGRREASKGSKSSSRSRSGADTGTETRSRLACPADGCDRTFANQRTLDRHTESAHPVAVPLPAETTPEAVERLLTSIKLTDRDAAAVAIVRGLAETFDLCEPSDKAKTAKELTKQLVDILDDQAPTEADWTEDDE